MFNWFLEWFAPGMLSRRLDTGRLAILCNNEMIFSYTLLRIKNIFY